MTSINDKCDALAAILNDLPIDDPRFDDLASLILDLIDHPRDFLDHDAASCDAICDLIIRDPLYPLSLDLINSYAMMIDPHQSFHAAHIRDAIRDNTDFFA